MFGMNRKPKGLFAQPRVMGAGILPGDQPDYGMGDFPAVPQEVPHNYAQNGNAGKKRGGLFGTGIQLRDVVGIAGDAVAINRGMTPMFAQSQQQERLAKQKALLAEQEAQRERAEWIFREQWKRENPAPRVNDTEADYAFWQSKLTPEEFAVWKKNRVSPPVWRQGEDGRFYQMETAPAGGDAPDTLPADFFGQGGATPGGSPTFREAFAGY